MPHRRLLRLSEIRDMQPAASSGELDRSRTLSGVCSRIRHLIPWKRACAVLIRSFPRTMAGSIVMRGASKMRHAALLTFVGLFCLGCAVCPACADDWEKEWIAPANAQIRINAEYGNIRIDAGDFKLVTASVRTARWRIAPDDVNITAKKVDKGIELEVNLRASRKYWQVGYAIDIELTVPRSASLDIHTKHGNITTHGVEGSLRSDTDDGNIEAVGGKGSVQVHTVDGNISANKLDGSISAETGSGNVNLEGRFEDLDVRTGNGNLAVTALAGSRVSLPWRLRTGDGSILLRMQDDMGADLHASTGDGRVMVEFPVSASGTKDSRTVRSPKKSGEQELRIHTGDGNSINIEKR